MWNAQEQRYLSYVAGVSADFALVNGSGYFVFVAQETTVTFTGAGVTGINMSLAVGYDLIGWVKAVATTASSLAENLSFCAKVAMWNASDQSWLAEYIVALGDLDFDILAGEAVFVFMTRDALWQGRGLGIPPQTLNRLGPSPSHAHLGPGAVQAVPAASAGGAPGAPRHLEHSHPGQAGL